jgi:sec-independent protein translocase protein TatB
MFDIGFLELLLVSIVGLLVLGPDRLPGAIRTVSLYVGKLRRSFNSIRSEIERELHADEIRQELHNQAVLQQLRETEKQVRQGLGVDDVKLGKDGYPVVDDDQHAAGGEATGQQESTPDVAADTQTTAAATTNPDPDTPPVDDPATDSATKDTRS